MSSHYLLRRASMNSIYIILKIPIDIAHYFSYICVCLKDVLTIDVNSEDVFEAGAYVAVPIAVLSVLATYVAASKTSSLLTSSLENGFFHCKMILDRKSTRLNSSHQIISYAVFCLKKKKTTHRRFEYPPAHMPSTGRDLPTLTS